MGRGVLRVQRQRARDWAGENTPPSAPPVNVDVPFVTQAGDTLSCTMGNWNGEPTAYAYQWQRDGTVAIGTGGATYAVTAEDVDHLVRCIVTATNASGATEAPPSNEVLVVSPSKQGAAR
jgi:hypothetical protein